MLGLSEKINKPPSGILSSLAARPLVSFARVSLGGFRNPLHPASKLPQEAHELRAWETSQAPARSRDLVKGTDLVAKGYGWACFGAVGALARSPVVLQGLVRRRQHDGLQRRQSLQFLCPSNRRHLHKLYEMHRLEDLLGCLLLG